AGNIAGRGGLRRLEPSYSSTDSPSASGASGPRRNRRSKAIARGRRHIQEQAATLTPARQSAPRTALRERARLGNASLQQHGETSRRGQDDAPRRRNKSIPNLGPTHK